MKTLLDAINNQVRILDLCSEHSIDVERVSSGNFTHRCKCPSPNHKSGGERTPSLMIDDNNNNFYCFGCNANNTPINFYNLIYPDMEVSDCISTLKTRVDTTKKYPKRFKQNNYQLQIEMSSLLRYYNRKYPEEKEYMLKVQRRLDENMSKIDYNDVVSTTKLLSALRSALRSKFS